MTVKPLSASHFDWMILEYKIPTFMTVKPLSVILFDAPMQLAIMCHGHEHMKVDDQSLSSQTLST
jgi:hypothetical protein